MSQRRNWVTGSQKIASYACRQRIARAHHCDRMINSRNGMPLRLTKRGMLTVNPASVGTTTTQAQMRRAASARKPVTLPTLSIQKETT